MGERDGTPPPRKIIHVDMDAFFASVEQRDNPELRGKPVAVGRQVKASDEKVWRNFGSILDDVWLAPRLPFAGVPEARMDVSAWLRHMGLEQYDVTFRDDAIDGEVLPADGQ